MASGFQFRWSGFISSQLGEPVSLVRHFHMSTFPDIFVMLQVLFKREHQIVSCGKVKVHNNFSIKSNLDKVLPLLSPPGPAMPTSSLNVVEISVVKKTKKR